MCTKNSSATTVGMFSNFTLLRDRCTLLPFPSTLTSLCAPLYIYVRISIRSVGEEHVTHICNV